mmetsp:Transcript_82149/g.129391  ORF Transcript_82149/g.129391 Transcript_82149/m.129391 type:complete len:244 (+) Transcript_82149:72-803(+)
MAEGESKYEETPIDKYDKEWALSGEVGPRRQRKVTKEQVQKEEEEYVSLAWDDIFPKKPNDRKRWLYKAMEAARHGKIKSQPLFDIIVHRKFLEGLKGQIATDCLNIIRGDLEVFSRKQQKQLTSDSYELFRKFAPMNVLDSDEDEDDAPPLPPPPKVIIEPKEKKKRKQQAIKEKEDEDGDSDDDLDTKRIRKLSSGVERRIDKADGQAYSLPEFVEQYGGSVDAPPQEWHLARATSFIFKE